MTHVSCSRTLTRVPKKALHPHTGEELDLGVTRAERELEQAREIANRERVSSSVIDCMKMRRN